MGKIFFLMGKSASGKDTIYQKLLECDELNLKTVVGYTTRPIRQRESRGKEYYFVDQKYFNEICEKNQLIESRTYHTVMGDWIYFTVDDGQIDLNDGNYLYIGTLESYQQMMKYFGSDNLIPIYIKVDNGLRLERALRRERRQPKPGYKEMCRRFLADEEDFSEEKLEASGIYKYYNNRILKKCMNKIIKDIKEIITL